MERWRPGRGGLGRSGKSANKSLSEPPPTSLTSAGRRGFGTVPTPCSFGTFTTARGFGARTERGFGTRPDGGLRRGTNRMIARFFQPDRAANLLHSSGCEPWLAEGGLWHDVPQRRVRRKRALARESEAVRRNEPAHESARARAKPARARRARGRFHAVEPGRPAKDRRRRRPAAPGRAQAAASARLHVRVQPQ